MNFGPDSEIGVGAIILTEEMPARYRGAAITLMFSVALVGGIAGSILYPFLIDTGFGWRTLYLAGGAALPVLLFFWRHLQETQRWSRDQLARIRPRTSLLASYRDMLIVFQPKYRSRAVVGTSIWFALNAWSASVLFFFVYYVTNERGWEAAQVSSTLTLGYTLSIIGYVTAGPMLEWVGRRITVCAYFLIGGLASITCFLSESDAVIAVAYMLMLSTQALWAIAATITSEIFPTQVRGAANAVVNNLLGRTGMVLAPSLIGLLSTWLGLVDKA